MLGDPDDKVAAAAFEYLDALVNSDKIRNQVRDVVKDINDPNFQTNRAELLKGLTDSQSKENLRDKLESLNLAGDIFTPIQRALRSDDSGKMRALLLLRNYTLTRRLLINIASVDTRSLKFEDNKLATLPADLDTTRPQLQALRPLLADLMLRDRSDAVRRTAAETLENLATDAANQAPALMLALRDRSLFVRWISARALGMLAGSEGFDNAAAVDALRRHPRRP